MNFRTPLTSVLSLLMLLFVSQAVLAETLNDEAVDWENAPPSLIHQRLHEGKLAGRLDQKFAESTLGLSTEADAMDDYDVLFYDVKIRVNDTTEVLYGRVTFVIEALADLSQIEFDFYRYMGIDSITSGGQQIGMNRNFDIGIAEPLTPITAGEIYTFEVYYFGHPPTGGFQAFSFDERAGNKVISSLSEPYYARTWWPCKDRMTDKPDSMNIAIECDTTFFCASNGILDSIVQSSNNSDTYYYTVRYPIVTYLFSVAISVYTVWEDTWNYDGGSMPIVNHVYPDLYTYSLPRWGLMPTILDVLTPYFGQYPFIEEKYGHANFEWGGGMEHQTVTSMIGSSFGFATSTVVHEFAHQWWGDMITCASWHDIWLNEGWASYAEALYFQLTAGWPTYRSYMNSMAYTGGGTVYCQDTTSVNSIFNNGLSYDKGAWVCHMLRGVLGDTLFFKGINDYYHSEFQYAAATTEDFKNVFEASSGQELDWYFEDWVHGTYRPNYHWSYYTELRPDNDYDLYVIVDQVQVSNPQVFRMPVPFFVDYDSAPDDTLVLKCDERHKVFKMVVPSSIANMTIDPADWVMKYDLYEPWGVRIITESADLSIGNSGEMYNDTLFAIGGSGDYSFSVVGGFLPAGISLFSNGIMSGIPVESLTSQVTFKVTDNTLEVSNEVTLTVEVGQCCGETTDGYSGNTDCDLEGKRNLSDITRLIDYVYVSHVPLCCPSSGNTDGDFSFNINLGDITRLIDHVYISKNETAACF